MRPSFSFFRFFVPKVFIFYLFLSQVALGDEYKPGSLFLEINGDKERVIEIESGMKNIEKKVSEAEENARALIGVEKDIEYMKSTLERIEVLVTK